MDDFSQLKQDVFRLRRELTELGNTVTNIQPPFLGSPLPSLNPIVPIVSPSVVNQIRNGEFGHSVNTWNDVAYAPTADKGKECAWWFSNDTPTLGQILDFTTALTNSTNKTLKWYGSDGGVHSTYDANYCDWDRSTGEARLHALKTLDAPLPNNRLAAPNRAVEYFGSVAAFRNNTIVAPDDCNIFAGIWDNTTGDWLRGLAFTITTTSVRGTSGSTTERRYKVRAFTDRGYQYLSAEATVVNAPSDAGFANADVFLSWPSIPGILRYEVHRFDVVAGVYKLLIEDLVTTNYVDNGAFVTTEAGYPSATDTIPRAYVATRNGDLANLPVDGDPWAALYLNIPIPSDYDLSLTTAEQVLRLGLTKSLDRRMTDAVVVSGNTNLDSATAAFTSLDTGRSVVVTDPSGNSLSTTITYVDSDSVTLGSPWPYGNASGVTLYITGGGDHGILIDAAHMSYVPNAAFAPYPEDFNRTLNPVAAPNHSSQGGPGGPGGGGPIDTDPGSGGIGCVALDCPIGVLVGNQIQNWTWKAIRIGDWLFSGSLQPNYVKAKYRTVTDNLYVLRVKGNWLFDIELSCSPKHPVVTSRLDGIGRAVEGLQVGDEVMVSIGGYVMPRKVKKIIPTGRTEDVGTFNLNPSHIYCAGRVRHRSVVHKLLAIFIQHNPVVGVLSHNVKLIENAL